MRCLQLQIASALDSKRCSSYLTVAMETSKACLFYLNLFNDLMYTARFQETVPRTLGWVNPDNLDHPIPPKVRYFKAQGKVQCWTKSDIYETLTYMLWWGARGEVDVDHKFTGIKTYSLVSAEDWASKTAWSSWSVCEMFDNPICCKFPVHKYLPYSRKFSP